MLARGGLNLNTSSWFKSPASVEGHWKLRMRSQNDEGEAVLGFVGIPLNAARAALWYSPFSLLGYANYAAHRSGFGYSPIQHQQYQPRRGYP